MLDKQAIEGVTPKALRDRPQLDFRQVQFFNAYQQLAGSRNVSMSGAMPIPVSEMQSYCSLFKIHNVEHIETLVDRITFLDGVYLEHAAEQSKKK